MKKIIFLCFHEHKNAKLNHFSSISKGVNFRVLQSLSANQSYTQHDQIRNCCMSVVHHVAVYAIQSD
jgi:hypothetical protein